MQVTVNGKPIYPTPLLDFLKTPDGLKKCIIHLETLRNNFKPVKDHLK